MRIVVTGLLIAGLCCAAGELERLRALQNRGELEKTAAALEAAAVKNANNADGWYQAATARSYLAEVAYEMRDKRGSLQAAEAGVRSAEKAVALNPNNADYNRVLGTLCGQVIPANPLLGALQYGRRAKDSLEKALELNPKSPKTLVAHGVGFYYLPSNLGGGPENAMNDYRKAIAIDPKNAEAYLWLGVAYAKENKFAEARKAFTQSLQFDPDRVWTKEQLAKVTGK